MGCEIKPVYYLGQCKRKDHAVKKADMRLVVYVQVCKVLVVCVQVCKVLVVCVQVCKVLVVFVQVCKVLVVCVQVFKALVVYVQLCKALVVYVQVVSSVTAQLSGVGLSITAVVLYSINLALLRMDWLCNDWHYGYYRRESTGTPIDNSSDMEKCLEGLSIIKVIINIIIYDLIIHRLEFTTCLAIITSILRLHFILQLYSSLLLIHYLTILISLLLIHYI